MEEAQQAQQDDDLRDLLTDEEVAMLLDDLLDPPLPLPTAWGFTTAQQLAGALAASYC